MEIEIPPINGEKRFIDNKNSIVLIGANGSGKTRMSVWIDNINSININVHRISAQRSLDLPDRVNTSEMQLAEENFVYGRTDNNKAWLRTDGKRNGRWNDKPETHMLSDFQQLMVLLMTENYEKSIEYRENHKNGIVAFDNETWLEKIKRIWENVITHRKLKICAGKIEVYNSEPCEKLEDDKKEYTEYNGSEMSDGERGVFHYIGEVLCAANNSLIIVDEPENHLHKSIINRLWNAIEAERQDCIFLYVTHDLEFADSRINSQIIWVKNFEAPDKWEYELIDNVNVCEPLKSVVMGSRQDVLLVEGNAIKSLDRKLYAKVFKEYNVLPLDNCNNVIQAVKAYNLTKSLHYATVKGIIDRDRRSEEEVLKLKEDNVFMPEVAEIENLFLLPEIIELVAKKQSFDEDRIKEIVSSVKGKIIEFLKDRMEEQALLFTKQYCQNIINQKLNSKNSTIDEYKFSMSQLIKNEDIQSIYEKELKKLQDIVERENCLEALKVINDKSLLSYTKLPTFFGWKQNYYIDYVLRLINNDEDGRKLNDIFRCYIKIV